MSRAAKLASLASASETALSNRNILINGNFQCWQRSTSETGLGAASGYFTADRWQTVIGATSAGRYTQNRTAGDPDGFNYGLVINCTTADTSIASGEALILRQKFEGQDLQQLYKGTSSAKKTVLCFYAKVVGAATDIVVEIRDRDNDRHICKLFTLTTSFAKYEFIIDGDTTGALDQDTACSMDVSWFLHAGSDYTSGTLQTTWASRTQANRAVGIDSIFASTSNEFYIAGVQWEVSPVATPFEHRSFGQELALCQRYFETHTTLVDFHMLAMAQAISSTQAFFFMPFLVTKRAAPTATFSASGTFTAVTDDGSNAGAATAIAAQTSDINGLRGLLTVGSGLSAGDGSLLQMLGSQDSAATVKLDSEL